MNKFNNTEAHMLDSISRYFLINPSPVSGDFCRPLFRRAYVLGSIFIVNNMDPICNCAIFL